MQAIRPCIGLLCSFSAISEGCACSPSYRWTEYNTRSSLYPSDNLQETSSALGSMPSASTLSLCFNQRSGSVRNTLLGATPSWQLDASCPRQTP